MFYKSQSFAWQSRFCHLWSHDFSRKGRTTEIALTILMFKQLSHTISWQSACWWRMPSVCVDRSEQFCKSLLLILLIDVICYCCLWSVVLSGVGLSIVMLYIFLFSFILNIIFFIFFFSVITYHINVKNGHSECFFRNISPIFF